MITIGNLIAMMVLIVLFLFLIKKDGT